MKTYRGRRLDGDGVLVEVVDDPVFGGEDRRPGERGVTPLVHHRKHSPAGFEWGYFGSGPADLARSILIDHLGPDAWCQTCGGQGVLTAAIYNLGPRGDADGCFACLGEGTGFGPKIYHSFKLEVVSNWGDGWEITAAEVAAFLARYPADEVVPGDIDLVVDEVLDLDALDREGRPR